MQHEFRLSRWMEWLERVVLYHPKRISFTCCLKQGATKIWLQGENYDVKIFAEWWEAVGFAIASCCLVTFSC
ncbi:MAG: hypothetical protein ACLU4N_16045 [Butyricimonas faecihominis]